jgi:hypothetical protein
MPLTGRMIRPMSSRDEAILVALAMCMAALPLTTATRSALSPQNPVVSVPFVGCRVDGQTGPVEAPKRESKVVPTSAEVARQLAYYESEQGLGVLAPRGWYCFGTYGSSGVFLSVSPEPIDATTLFSTTRKGFDGPAVRIDYEYGDTSGRTGVANMIARVFPAHRAFVDRVIAEGIWPAGSFPSGPYPKDKATYKSKEIVEYETPAQTEGLGTSSGLRKDADPIRGVVILVGQTPDLLRLSVRLSSSRADLTPAIIRQVERGAASHHP